MFNFHIGLPGLMPNLLSSLTETGILTGHSSAGILTRDDWKRSLRTLINSRKRNELTKPSDWRAAEELISELSRVGNAVGSQHALLGSCEDCFMKRRPLPNAEARIARLSELFSDTPLTLHLTVISQFDYFGSTIESKIPRGETVDIQATPSWSDLVARIINAAPNSRIVVWDFEEPSKVLLAFLIHILDLEDLSVVDAISDYLEQHIDNLVGDPSHTSSNLVSEDLAERWDAQYDWDLEKLSQMGNVTLVTANTIHENLYITH